MPPRPNVDQLTMSVAMTTGLLACTTPKAEVNGVQERVDQPNASLDRDFEVRSNIVSVGLNIAF